VAFFERDEEIWLVSKSKDNSTSRHRKATNDRHTHLERETERQILFLPVALVSYYFLLFGKGI